MTNFTMPHAVLDVVRRVPGKMPGLLAAKMAGLLILVSPALAGQNIVILLDDSGSMSQVMQSSRQTRIDAAKGALQAVLKDLPADASVGVAALNSGGNQRWLIPLGPVKQEQVRRAIDRIQAGGDTPLGACMKVAADGLLAFRERQKYGDYRLLIVTDGEANDQQLVERYLPEILARGLIVDVIGVDMRQDHSLATAVHYYRRADDPASLEQAVAQAVQGETTIDSSDAGETDFELLQAFPDQMATAALVALSAQSNAPIGEDEGDANGVQGPAPWQAGSPIGRPDADPSPEGGGLSALLCVVMALVVMVFLAAKLLRRGS